MFSKSIVVKSVVVAIVAALAVSSLAFAKQLPKTTPKAAASAPLSAALLQSDWKVEEFTLKVDNFVLTRVWRALDRFVGRLSKRPADHFSGRLGVTLRDVEALLAKAQSIVASHAGFDASGNVTDAATAQKTVSELAGILHMLRGDLILKLESMRFS